MFEVVHPEDKETVMEKLRHEAGSEVRQGEIQPGIQDYYRIRRNTLARRTNVDCPKR